MTVSTPTGSSEMAGSRVVVRPPSSPLDANRAVLYLGRQRLLDVDLEPSEHERPQQLVQLADHLLLGGV